ncbi:CHRD domain-containing protein [Polynucleobacter paneuropaeus]|uniref:CHRD domain-containing protein n=1 Tax=Polynucleobacter paneuropaeus TaxID=2527775 RepID=A0AAE2YKE0_9BURK|nr:CHRD domain-containing protein [Polynucleobacter sp. JS-Fieb-80-E5]MBT8589499.1 CHRD domain-containing protein [Polynucleobacter paneuropaeus]MBT8591130.1 CHRD domain-containing protein [Polynucleobacter paneuropaeus]MBT8596520.1 CHRD domain-containing protein [Polynucleobacter paneuropaeus]MBT8598333.1 CHRD domain-containing protein [Polynucleobacter paneuropaeus]MBU3618148.1 CHRD domain-containing protein [Polynucleobacter sp. JS-Fieb-80-E5]
MKINHVFAKAALVFSVGIASLGASAQSMKVTLTGSQEVPPVTTSASGVGSIMVAPDGSVSGTITTMGMEGTMAHIHEAPMGQNGPVIVPFSKTADNVWSAPAGAKLTEAQIQSLKSGNLYLNVHSATNKSGEIRAQLK